MLNISLLTLFSFFVTTGNTTLFVPPAQTTPFESYRIELDASYFYPTSRFDYDGSSLNFQDNEDFWLAEGNAKILYGFTRQLEIFGGLRLRAVESTNADGESVSNSGVESLIGGIKFGTPRWIDNWRISAEASYRYTPYSNKEFPPGEAPNDEIILGDDGHAFLLGLHAARNEFLLGSQFRGFIGYHRPPNYLSQEVVFDFSLNWRAFEKWLIGAGVKGVQALGLDDFDDAPEEKPSLNTGSTNLFNSINRQIVEPYARLGRQFGPRSHLVFEASGVVQGESTDEGLRFFLGLSWSTRGTGDEVLKRESFKEYSIEATVIEVSPRETFVQIDQGLGQSIEKGTRFDLYKTDFFGGNVLVAHGIVFEARASTSVIRITRKYQDIPLEPGLKARAR